MGEVDETTSIKLFGTVILKVEKKDALEEEETAVAAAVPLQCPRCKSRETKFCYFNNYNMNQPRHFCKACHRYWTAGGALRNVPVGAGRRRGRPAPSSGAAATAAACVLGYSSSPAYRNAGGRWLLRSDESARTSFGSVGGGESC